LVQKENRDFEEYCKKLSKSLKNYSLAMKNNFNFIS